MRRQGGRAILAPRARAALDETLGRGEQAVVLLNRRGYAGFLQCEVCGEVRMCPQLRDLADLSPAAQESGVPSLRSADATTGRVSLVRHRARSVGGVRERRDLRRSCSDRSRGSVSFDSIRTW